MKKNDILQHILIGKAVTIETGGLKWFGVVKEFHKHIDGGIVLKNCYEASLGKYYNSCIIAKLCIPDLGETNYTTEIRIEEDKIKLIHHSNRNVEDSIIEIITILEPLHFQ